MNENATFDRVASYLTVNLSRTGPVGADHLAHPFVTISREAGTGGSLFAAALSRRLRGLGDAPWEVHSGDLIEEMLRTRRLPPQLARFLPEDRIHELDSSVGELLGLHPSLWTLVAALNELMRQLARTGHTILLGRGANFATDSLPHGIHVRLVASPRFRAAATAQRFALSPELALERNSLCDAARRRYVRSNFDRNVEDALAYTLVLNVDRLSLAAQVETVAAAMQRGAQVAPPASAALSPVQFSATG